MKKIITFLSSIFCLISTHAQWVGVPTPFSPFSGIMQTIDVGASNQVVGTAYHTNGSGYWIVYKFNFATNTWDIYQDMQLSGINIFSASIAPDGTVWSVSSTNTLYKNNVLKTGALSQISSTSTNRAVGCSPGNFFTFNVYESNSADAFSLLSVSSYPPNVSLSQVEVGDDGTLFGIQNPGVNASNYMFKLENGNFVNYSLGFFDWVDIAVGDATKVLAVRNGWLYYLDPISNSFVRDITAPANVTKASVAGDGTVYILTSGTANNIYKNTWAAILCGSIPMPTLAVNQYYVCPGNTASFTASASGTINWYSSLTSTVPIYTGTTFTTPPANNFTTYYVENVVNGCASNRELAYVSMSAVPATPVNNTPTANLTVCPGQGTTLTAVAPSSYSITNRWLATDTSTVPLATGDSLNVPGSLLNSTSTFYLQAIRTSSGCTSAMVPVTVTLGNGPAAPVNTSTAANLSICAGSSANLTATGSGTISWYSDASATNLLTTGTSYTTPVLNATSNYYLRINGSPCPSPITTITVTINPLPSQPLNTTPSASLNICSGNSTTLTASTSANAEIKWYSATGSFLGTGASFNTAVLTGNTTIIARAEIPGSPCISAFTSFDINVTPAPVAGTLSGTQAVCTGSTTTFSSTVSGGTWSSSNTAIASVNASGVVTGLAAGSATITYTVAGSGPCTNATATRTVNVTAAPNAGSLSGVQAICLPGTSAFSTTGSGGTWSSSNTAVATVNATTGLVTGVAAGTATITYTVVGSGPCANATATRTIEVFSTITAGTLSGTQAVCAGSTTSFSSTVSGGTWSSSSNGIATVNASTGVVTGVSAGTATITYTIAGVGACPSASATRTVTVTAAPSAGTLSGAQSICLPGTTNFSSTVSGGTWSSSNTSVATVNASGVVTGVSVGSATITYTVAGTGGCSNATATRTVTVDNVPTAAVITGNSSVCLGEISNLTSSSSSGTWSSSNNAIASVNSLGEVSGLAAGTADIIYTVPANGTCAAVSTSYPITVNTASPTTILTETICFGDSFFFNGQYYSSNINILTPILTNSFGCDSGAQLILSVLPELSYSSSLQLCIGESYDFFGQTLVNDGIYTEVLISSTGCDSTVSLDISFVSQIISNFSLTICDGESYVFGTQTVSVADVYTETFVSSGACDSVVTLDLSVSSLPSGIVVSQNGSELSVNDDFDSYFWFSEADPLTVLGTDPTFTASVSGSYYVAVYNASGCSALSDVLTVVISGIKDLAGISFSVYPNPAKESLSITNLPLGAQVSLSNLSGQTIYETTIKQNIEVLDLSNVANGFYLISASQDGILLGTSRFIVSK
ncbi:MAG: Ig-like domain-containing protein [Chitinophagales bacterium]|nr:Ig-like domain-containing protein [Chitinophagales bacterium]